MSTMMLQSVQRDSFFTRLDFRPKLALLVAVTTVAFVWESPLLGGLLALVVIVASLVAGVKFRYVRRLLISLLPVCLLVIATQGFFADEIIRTRTGQATLTPMVTLPEDWWLFGGATMSTEGLKYGLNVAFKMITMTLMVPLVVFTTDVNTMIVGMVKAHIPYQIAFVFSSTLRFFPLLFGDLQNIIEVQRLRGLSIERMGPIRRARVYGRVAVPLILGAIVKSQTLEVVLQSKAFSGRSERTYLHESQLGAADYALLVLSALFLVAALVCYIAFDIGRFGGPL